MRTSFPQLFSWAWCETDGGTDLPEKKTCVFRVSFNQIRSLIWLPGCPHKQKCRDKQCGVAWDMDGLEGSWDGREREEKARKVRKTISATVPMLTTLQHQITVLA